MAVFPDYDFSVSGVYCHQKPIVDINLDKKPELGDILIGDILAEYEQSVPGKLYVREVVPLPEIRESPKHTPRKVRDVRGWARSTISRWSREKK